MTTPTAAAIVADKANRLYGLLDAIHGTDNQYERILKIWLTGCSCTEHRKPWQCEECTAALASAAYKMLDLEQGAQQ